jgi:hypothetical protein
VECLTQSDPSKHHTSAAKDLRYRIVRTWGDSRGLLCEINEDEFLILAAAESEIAVNQRAVEFHTRGGLEVRLKDHYTALGVAPDAD